MTEWTEAERQKILPSLDEFMVVEPCYQEGAYGIIDKGIIKSTAQPVAMKRIQRACDEDAREYYEALVKEFKFMCGVSHPALQTVIGLYHPEKWEETVLVTPFCEFQSLRQWLPPGPLLNDTMRTRIILGVCSAMDTLHDANIVHRDLKPDNIVIDEKLWPVLTDFGMARVVPIESLMSSRVGSEAYMAPELWDDEPLYDKSIDVYSFGVIVYELFTGGRPEVDKRYIFDIPAVVPEAFAEIIRECIQPPEKRPTFGQIYEHLLHTYPNLSVNIAEIDEYRQVITNRYFHCDMFRIPSQIVTRCESPAKRTDGLVLDSSPILVGELRRILEREEDRHVVFVMVIGHVSSGKSTYLRMLTGNAAFYPGNGENIHTNGVLLDGPYHVSELIERLPGDGFYRELKEQCHTINIPSDPSIYFLDCESLEQEESQDQRQFLDLVRTVFASVSTICIDLSRYHESQATMKADIAAVRRAQLMPNPVGPGSKSQLLFLVRDYPEYLDTSVAHCNHIRYQNMLPLFRDRWMRENESALAHYIPDCIQCVPLGNVKSGLQNYFKTVGESLHTILQLIAEAPVSSGLELLTIVEDLSQHVFHANFWEIIESVRGFQLTSLGNNDTLRHCLGCFAHLSTNLIRLLTGSSDDRLWDTVDWLEKTVVRVALPYILGEDDIPWQDVTQYFFEVAKEAQEYVESNKKPWKELPKKVSRNRIITASTGVGSAVAGAACCVIPVVGCVVGTAIATAGIAGSVIAFKRAKDPFTRIQGQGITMLFPQIWKRNMIRSKERIKETSKLVKPLSERPLIVFYEQPDRGEERSRLLVQSLLGVTLPKRIQKGRSYYFSSLKVADLIKRQSREDNPNVLATMPKVLDFLYVGDLSKDELQRLEGILGPSTFWVTSECMEPDGTFELEVCPNAEANFYAFVISDQHFATHSVISLIPFVTEVNSLTGRCRESNSTGERSFYLPVYASNYDFESNGPRTNVSLRYCCRYILGEQNIRETVEQ